MKAGMEQLAGSGPASDRRGRGRVGLLAALVAALVCLCGVGTGSAFANSTTWTQTGKLEGGTLEEPVGVGVNQSTGAVYVSNYEGAVEQYNAAGQFESEVKLPSGNAYELAIDNSGGPSEGSVYVAGYSRNVVYKYKTEANGTFAAGAPEEIGAGDLKEPTGVAVGPNGNVYVASIASQTVSEFTEAGAVVAKDLISGLKNTQGLAIDPAGDIYVAQEEFRSGTVEYSPSGACVNACTPINGEKNNRGVVVGAGGRILISAQEIRTIDEYSTSGETHPFVQEIDSGEFELNFQLALNESAARLYVVDYSAGTVDVFTGTTMGTEQSLEVIMAGEGRGSVASAPAGVKCGGAICYGQFAENEKVTLTETPTARSYFEGWSGCEAESSGKCEVTMSKLKQVRAKFGAEPIEELTLSATKASEGTIEGNGLDCGSKCALQIDAGESVSLTAKAAAGFAFAEWTEGPCNGSNVDTCTFTMEEAVNVAASYTKTKAEPLTIYVSGDGTVTSSPGLIDCAGPTDTGVCSESLENTVTLTATPASSEYVFVGWLGCKRAAETTCTVQMTGAVEVTAVFLKEGNVGKEGPQGEPGEPGLPGPPGVSVEAQPGHEGKEGKQGLQGEDGLEGPQGMVGPVGPAGPAGAQGPEGKRGPAGKVELVTCTVVKHAKKCTSKTVSGNVKVSDSVETRAMLSRRGKVFAAGVASVAHGRLSLRLRALRKLRRGHYTLTLISGSGAHEKISTLAFTLQGTRA